MRENIDITTTTTTTSEKNECENTELNQLSYEEIIECIQENKEVPNMVDVPDIVLSSDMISKPSLPIRQKPWEIAKSEITTASTNETDTNDTAAAELSDSLIIEKEESK